MLKCIICNKQINNIQKHLWGAVTDAETEQLIKVRICKQCKDNLLLKLHNNNNK